MATKRHLVNSPSSEFQPEIGRFIWMIEDCRSRTLDTLAGITQEVIDWQHPQFPNSIGTLMYHIAAIELDWLANEVMEGKMPEAIWHSFPYKVRNEQGRLTPVIGVLLEQHMRRLSDTRELLLEVFRNMTKRDFFRVRELDDYNVTPEWVLHHLMQHEGQHRGEIAVIRHLAEERGL